MPRTTRLTPEIQKQIVSHIQEGNFFSVSCKLAGIPEDTAREWLSRGLGTDGDRDRREPYASFAHAVKKAEAEAEAAAIARIQAAAKGQPLVKRKYEVLNGKKVLVEETITEEADWTAAAWYLERKFPDRWAKKRQYELMQMVEAMAAQGLLVPGQAGVISEGVDGIQEGLKAIAASPNN